MAAYKRRERGREWERERVREIYIFVFFLLALLSTFKAPFSLTEMEENKKLCFT